jgi:hypothetical protein
MPVHGIREVTVAVVAGGGGSAVAAVMVVVVGHGVAEAAGCCYWQLHIAEQQRAALTRSTQLFNYPRYSTHIIQAQTWSSALSDDASSTMNAATMAVRRQRWRCLFNTAVRFTTAE